MGKSKHVLFFLVLTATLSSALGAAWTTKKLTNAAAESYSSAIAVSGANVYVAWYGNAPGNFEVYFRRSTDNGATWQATKRLTYTDGQSGPPDIAANGANVYVTWNDNTPGNAEVYFKRSADNGATWEPSQRLTNNSGHSNYPRIAFSGANLYLAWTDNTAGHANVYFRKSIDGGATWQSAKQLTNKSVDVGGADIVSYGSNIYIVWCDDSSGNREIYFKKSTDKGASWQTQKRLTNNSGDSHDVAIAVDDLTGSDLYVVWEDDTAGNWEVYFMKSTDKGATWETCKNLTHNSGDSNCPSIAVRGANVYVTWYDITPGTTEIYVKKSADSGSTWQSSKRITNNVGASNNPVIALSASNQYVTFHDYTPGNYEIFVKYAPL